MFGPLIVFEPVTCIPDYPLAGTFSAQLSYRLNVIHVVVT
jgi:hypothetical protein